MDHSWVFFGLLSAISAAFVAIFGKIGLEGIDTHVATTVRGFVMFVFLLLVILFMQKSALIFQLNSKALIFIILSGIAGALSWLFYFFALKIGEASKVAPIDRLSVVFVLIFGALFLGEKITIFKAGGILLMVTGAILLIL
ncbi:EamA family transporter [Candidatus Woesearchaeota archaeon]|nr:EamA family transporter [Candidatus Woesearchaeota archaeon]